MRVNVYGCMLAFILGCDVTAEIISQIAVVRQTVTLPCARPMNGNVTWSKELSDGSKTDLITNVGNRDIRHNDPGRRFKSIADKSLSFIPRFSDSGRYFCNNEPAVELIMILSGGTELLNRAKGTDIRLTCPGVVPGSHHDLKWVRQIGKKNHTVRTEGSHHVEGHNLILRNIQPSDSALYFCNNKSVIHLNVVGDKGSKNASPTVLVLVLGVVIPLVLVIFIILFLVWRRRFKTREESSQQDITYTTVQHQHPVGNNNVVPRPNESIYSLIKTNN